ncbi:hypothetical protein [Silanimonas lenta]|uniref:hypothetical protein n=1 Tax=Silanimonas lenta TaxID=265429 RepID=UPI0012EB597A|nr:hypothetical protein [Silanimonas lenta]
MSVTARRKKRVLLVALVALPASALLFFALPAWHERSISKVVIPAETSTRVHQASSEGVAPVWDPVGRSENATALQGFDRAADLHSVAEHALALYGSNSREYLAVVGRIRTACEAARNVGRDPIDKFGIPTPSSDAAVLLLERCHRWIQSASSLPEPTFQGSELMARALVSLASSDSGVGALSPDSPVVAEAISLIAKGQSASEFLDALFIWFDAHPTVRDGLMTRNRLDDEGLGVAITLGSRLLECEIATACGPRSFATLELCVQVG